jgi:hypothetical protein
MALAKFGSIITDSRGSIGGTTLKWSIAGNLLTRKATPPQRTTPLQSVTRANFEMLSRYWWDQLDATQRTDWRALAAANPLPNRWGDTFPLTGLAFFIRTNQRLLKAGEGMMTDAPADQTVTSLTAATLSITAPSTASLSFTPTPVPADHLLILRLTAQQSPGKTIPQRGYLYASAYATSSASPLNVYSALSLITGDLHTGRQVFGKASFLSKDTGAESSPIAFAAIVA